MVSITASQMRKIHASARERGMDNDLLHVHVEALTGKESLKELTIHEAVLVIDSLEGRAAGAKEPGGATKRQMAYIYGLMKELGWLTEDGRPDEKRLNGFLSKRFGIDHFRWLTKAAASKAIEGLKNMASGNGKDA